MGLLKFFSGKDPEDHEQKGDGHFEADAFGKAIVEYEHALRRLEKASPWDDGYRMSLQDKIRSSKKALALQHQQTAKGLMEAGYPDDARQYFELALELAKDPETKNSLEQQLQNLETHQTEEIQIDLPDVEIPNQEDELENNPAEEPVYEEQDDEYFAALTGTLPEDIQNIYLGYGEAFKNGYLALNRGDFEKAAEQLAQAMEETPNPASYIPLELATACLNLGKYDEAQRLLEPFIEHHPDALPAYQLLCEIFWETKAFDRAELLLSSLPPELAESVAGFLLRGETLYHAENYAEAKSYYRNFFQTYEWNETMARALAKTHEALGELANARNIYSEIMAQCHSCHSRIDPFIKQKFADLSFASGLNTPEVLELYLSLAREVPRNAADYYQKISQIYSAQGNREEARRFQAISEKYEKKNDHAL